MMGSMALIRQVFHDAKWYAQGNATNKDLSLEAFNNNKSLLQIFNAIGFRVRLYELKRLL